MSLDSAILKRIAVAEPADAEIVSRNPTEATTVALPFYRRHRWVRLVVRLPHHPSALDYADDQTRMMPLSADPETIYRVNRAEQLRLSEGLVPAYVRFFMAITGEPGDVLVEQPSDVPWVPNAEQDEALKTVRAEVSRRVEPVRVAKADDGYRVKLQVVRALQLLELSLAVARDGSVRTLETRVLADALPVCSFE